MTVTGDQPLLAERGVAARIVLDSISGHGYRLTTFELRLHRFVLSEFNTHRVFSRNSASSRAIPLAKQVDRVLTDPAVPVVWAAEQSGMSGGEEIEHVEFAHDAWLGASKQAVTSARELGELGVHKSIANRLLEPFMWHTVVVTATAWENFFGLRNNPSAQPEIQRAARLMQEAYLASEPTPVPRGGWHAPFLQDDERVDMPIDIAIKVSAARCARVSYLTHNGTRDFEQDLQLYNKLTTAWPMHASPLEHVATSDPENVHTVVVKVHTPSESGEKVKYRAFTLPRYGNFLGWHSHRFDVEIDRDYQAFS